MVDWTKKLQSHRNTKSLKFYVLIYLHAIPTKKCVYILVWIWLSVTMDLFVFVNHFIYDTYENVLSL